MADRNIHGSPSSRITAATTHAHALTTHLPSLRGAGSRTPPTQAASALPAPSPALAKVTSDLEAVESNRQLSPVFFLTSKQHVTFDLSLLWEKHSHQLGSKTPPLYQVFISVSAVSTPPVS